jgi:hypothetical protein
MSDVRKVISFTAVDAGVTAMFDKARQASAKYTAAVIDDAKKAAAAFNTPATQTHPYIQQFNKASQFVDNFHAGNKQSMSGLSQSEKQDVRNEFARRRFQTRLNQQHEAAMGELNEKFYGTASGGTGTPPPAARLVSEEDEFANDRRNDMRQHWRGQAASRRRGLVNRSGGSSDAPADPTPATPTEEPPTSAKIVVPPPGFENTGTGTAGYNPRKKDDGERFSFTQEEARGGQRVPKESSAKVVSEDIKEGEKEKSVVEEIADDLVKEALAFSDDIKQQTKYLRDKVKEARQEFAQDTQQALVENDRRRDMALAAAGDDKEKISAANKEFKLRNQEIRKGSREDRALLTRCTKPPLPRPPKKSAIRKTS